MRVITFTLLYLALSMPTANAQIQRDPPPVSQTMPDPGENWFMSVTDDAGYIYDASSGEMYGLISISGHTPAIQPNPARREFYAAASYYSRGSYGDRTDVLTIHDYDNLSPIAEVDIPNKITSLSYRAYIGLMSEGRYVGVSNMTPAQSVSIVDVENRRFIGEISTPGCALIMPVENNGFLNICGDGTLQLIQLNASGNEANRVRSARFFDVMVDPVYDQPIATADGWLLISNHGKAFNVSTSGASINIGDEWSIVSEEDVDETWLPGGRQPFTVHRDFGFLYALMHQGEEYTHHEAGSEIWVIDINTERRIARIELETAGTNVMVTQEAEPKLVVGDKEGGTHVYDAITFRYDRKIEGPPGGLFEDL